MSYNLIQAARFNDALIKLLGMRQDAPAPDLGSEIQAVFELLNPPPELRYLMGERLAGAVGETGANVGATSFIGLLNPTNSGVLVIVERIQIGPVTAQVLDLRVNTTNVIDVGAGYHRDTRWQGTTTSAHLGGCNSAAGGAVIFRGYGTTTESTDFSVPIVLAPGGNVGVESQSLNTLMRGWFLWRERVLTSSER